MTITTEAVGAARVRPALDAVDGAASAVSWGAIVGGAVVIAAVALILLALGAGFGLSSVSPWPSVGASAKTFAVMTGIWLIVVQWLSAGTGGYVAGRLRSRWTGLHTEEVTFRDTAHGIVAWAVAAIVTAAFLTSAVSAIVGGAAQEATTLAAGAAQGASQGAVAQGASPGASSGAGSIASPSGYIVDTLFRSDHPDANANPQVARAEATRILANGLRTGDVPAGDKTYLAQLVAARTGISQDDAQKRVNDVIAKAKEADQKVREAADTARKAGRNMAFFIAFSMLVGAFVAGVAAKIGGNHRDSLV